MGNVTCQEKKPGQAGKMFWVDQSHGVSRFHGDVFSEASIKAKRLADRLDANAFGVDPDLAFDAAEALRSLAALMTCMPGADGAEHGGAHPRSGGAPAGAVLAAHPHGNHGDNKQ